MLLSSLQVWQNSIMLQIAQQLLDIKKWLGNLGSQD
jgi:hypothetical protein